MWDDEAGVLVLWGRKKVYEVRLQMRLPPMKVKA